MLDEESGNEFPHFRCGDCILIHRSFGAERDGLSIRIDIKVIHGLKNEPETATAKLLDGVVAPFHIGNSGVMQKIQQFLLISKSIERSRLGRYGDGNIALHDADADGNLGFLHAIDRISCSIVNGFRQGNEEIVILPLEACIENLLDLLGISFIVLEASETKCF